MARGRDTATVDARHGDALGRRESEGGRCTGDVVRTSALKRLGTAWRGELRRPYPGAVP